MINAIIWQIKSICYTYTYSIFIILIFVITNVIAGSTNRA